MNELAGKRILLTRSEEDNGSWARELAGRGARPISLPCLRREFLTERAGELRDALQRCEWIAFCSRHAVSAVATLAPGAWPGGPRIACVAPITAARAEAAFGRPELVAPLGSAANLAETLLATLTEDEKVLLIAAEEGRPEFEEHFAAAARPLERLVLYRTVPLPAETGELCPGADAIFFASPSAVRAFAARFPPPPGALLVALGPTTGAAIEALGWPLAGQSNTRDLSGMIQAATSAWTTPSRKP